MSEARKILNFNQPNAFVIIEFTSFDNQLKTAE